MRIWQCDKCKKQIKSIDKPKEIYDIKVYEVAQSKGGKSQGYHLCKECKEEIFGE